MGDAVTGGMVSRAVFADPASAATKRARHEYLLQNLRTVARDVREVGDCQRGQPETASPYAAMKANTLPDTLSAFRGKRKAGTGAGDVSNKVNRHRERIWFSPHCLNVEGDIPATQLLEYS